MKQDKNLSQTVLQNLNGQATEKIPLWLMRQAGRYLPEYRALRAEAGSFLNLAFTPDWAVEVTLQPIRRFDMDAAILFSDILVIPYALGQDLTFKAGEGPLLGSLDINTFDPDGVMTKLQPVYDAVKILRQELSSDKTLIGFAGAPWTVGCYMVDGRGKTGFLKTQKMMREAPDEFQKIIDVLVTSTARYLNAQIDAGADVVQIFDSWAGLLKTFAEFDRWSIQPTKKIIDLVRAQHPDTPIIGFPRQCGKFYDDYIRGTGVNGVGVDTDMDFVNITENVCLQGNLNPETLLKGGNDLEKEITKIISSAKGRPYIFNLGHGVIKETPPEHVAELVHIVKGMKRA